MGKTIQFLRNYKRHDNKQGYSWHGSNQKVVPLDKYVPFTVSACPQIPLMGDLIRLPTNFPRETFSEYPCYCHTNAQYGWSYGEVLENGILQIAGQRFSFRSRFGELHIFWKYISLTFILLLSTVTSLTNMPYRFILFLDFYLPMTLTSKTCT